MTNIYNLFNFIESKRPSYKTPELVKLLFNTQKTKNELIYNGDLRLSGNSVFTSLPTLANMTINGNLDLEGASIKSLPNNLTINGKLNLNWTREIKSLPNNLTVRSLEAQNSNITTIPADIQIIKYLDLSDSEINSLPENFSTNCFVNLQDTSIKSLPNNLTVNNDVTLNGSLINSIPKKLQISGYLDLRNTPISKKYTKDEIRKLIEKNGGSVKGEIGA
jgi:hypothetical protein